MRVTLTIGVGCTQAEAMSVKQATCPDCAARILIPYEFGWHPGVTDARAAARALLDHAREHPHPHPSLLADHDDLRRTA